MELVSSLCWPCSDQHLGQVHSALCKLSYQLRGKQSEGKAVVTLREQQQSPKMQILTPENNDNVVNICIMLSTHRALCIY